MVSLTSVPKSAKVLEPSFGEGVFLRELKQAGFLNVCGIEIDPDNFNLFKDSKFQLKLGDFFDETNKFDLIIGNPPYVQFKNISNSTRKKIENDPDISSYINRESDLFYFFIIKSLLLLNEGGELIFIVPGGFRWASYAQRLRCFMSKEGSFSAWIDLSENRIFKDAGPDPVIFVYKKGKMTNTRYIEFKKNNLNPKEIKRSAKDALNQSKTSNTLRSIKAVDFNQKWYFTTKTEHSLIKKIAGLSQRLEELAQVGVGFVSGAEAVFQKTDQIEPGLIRKFVKAKDCQALELKSVTEMIFTDDIESEQELKGYPLAYSYLKEHKQVLVNRHGIDPNLWWKWPTVRNRDLFERAGPKIFVPTIDRSPQFRFALDQRKLIASGDVMTILPEKVDPYFLLAWLNSDLFYLYFKITGPRKGGRVFFSQIKKIAVPYNINDSAKQKIATATRRREFKKANKLIEKELGV